MSDASSVIRRPRKRHVNGRPYHCRRINSSQTMGRVPNAITIPRASTGRVDVIFFLMRRRHNRPSEKKHGEIWAEWNKLMPPLSQVGRINGLGRNM